MTQFWTTLLALAFPIFFIAQNADTLNKYKAGKKNGFWIEYLDNEFKLTDEPSAIYRRLQYFDNGKPMYFNHGKGFKKTPVEYIHSGDTTNKHGLLNGNIRFFDNNGTILLIKYENGLEQYSKLYAHIIKDTGHVEIADYKRGVKGQVGSFYYEFWKKDFRQNKLILKETKIYCRRKGKWKLRKPEECVNFGCVGYDDF